MHSALRQSFHDLHGPEPRIIRSHQLVFHPAPEALDGQLVGIGMEVAVEAAPDAVVLEHLDDLPALIAPISGRIVEEDQLFPLPCRPQAGLQTAKLPFEDLGVMLPGLLLLEEPAPGAADRPAAICWRRDSGSKP